MYLSRVSLSIKLYWGSLSKRPPPLLTKSLTYIESPCLKGPSSKGPQPVTCRYPSPKCPWPLQSGPLQRVPNLYWVFLSRRPWLGLKCPVSNRSLTCTECPFTKYPWPVLSVPFQKIPDCAVHRDPPWLLLLPPLAYQSFLQEKKHKGSLHQLFEMFFTLS